MNTEDGFAGKGRHMSPSRWHWFLTWRGELLAPPAPLTNWEWMQQNTFPNGFLVFVLGRWARQKGTPALATGWLAGLATGRRPSRFAQAYI